MIQKSGPYEIYKKGDIEDETNLIGRLLDEYVRDHCDPNFML